MGLHRSALRRAAALCRAVAAVLAAAPAALALRRAQGRARPQGGVAHRPRAVRAPLIVGDSTMRLAVPHLAARGIEADARGCRQLSKGVDLLAARRRAGTLPAVAVLALGSNGTIGRSMIDRA